MRGPIRSVLLAAIAACVLGALTVGSASGATLKVKGATTAEAFLAIYGFPAHSNVAERPVGGGTGLNFGFGQNLLFQAGNGVGTQLSVTINAEVLKARESFIGATLASNHTGANLPLSFPILFVDLQDGFVGTTHVPAYTDTTDRHWIGEACSPEAAVGACKTDPQAGAATGEGAEPGEVKIENVSFDVGPGVVIQGTVWGTWKNGKAKVPPCIALHLPAAKPAGITTQTLYETQGPAVGKAITAISGNACLISANNKWYNVTEAPAEEEEPEIVLTNE